MNIRNPRLLLLACSCVALHTSVTSAEDSPPPGQVPSIPELVVEPGPTSVDLSRIIDPRRPVAVEPSPFDIVGEPELPPLDGNPESVRSIDGEIRLHEIPVGEERTGPLILDEGMPSIDVADTAETVYDDGTLTSTEEENDWLVPAAPKDERDIDIDDPVEAFLFAVHVHGPDIATARPLAADAFDRASAVLRDPGQIDHHANALTLIALGGHPEAEEAIFDYVLEPFSVEPSSGFAAKAAAIVSLGVLAAETEGEHGLDFLLETSDPKGWRGVALQWVAPGVEDTAQELAILSVSALSLSGMPAARNALAEIVGAPDEELVRRGLERTDVIAFLRQHERRAR